MIVEKGLTVEGDRSLVGADWRRSLRSPFYCLYKLGMRFRATDHIAYVVPTRGSVCRR
jgi:hypothetical protein